MSRAQAKREAPGAKVPGVAVLRYVGESDVVRVREIEFRPGEPVEVADPDVAARLSRNPFFEVVDGARD